MVAERLMDEDPEVGNHLCVYGHGGRYPAPGRYRGPSAARLHIQNPPQPGGLSPHGIRSQSIIWGESGARPPGNKGGFDFAVEALPWLHIRTLEFVRNP